jgi:hypothetical protein
MKRRKKRIDKRLEDINKSRTFPLDLEGSSFSSGRVTHLPPIPSTKPNPIPNTREEYGILRSNCEMGPSSSSTVFPIHEELGNSFECFKYENATLPLVMSQTLNELNNIDQRKTENEEIENLKAIRLPIKERRREDELFENVEYKMYPGMPDENIVCTSNLGDAWDSNSHMLAYDSEGISRIPPLQQSLEDALQAIKTCRYLRTPSTRTSETSELQRDVSGTN